MIKRLALLVLVILCVVGCGPQPLPLAPTPIPTLAPATLPPPLPTEPPAPVEPGETAPATGGDVEAGMQVFEQACSVCHNLTDEAKVGPGLAGLYEQDVLPDGNPVDDETLKVWIRTGGGAMPGIPLTDEQLSDVVAFLREATQP
jgi:mono/diheme cytochrome c family protein